MILTLLCVSSSDVLKIDNTDFGKTDVLQISSLSIIFGRGYSLLRRDNKKKKKLACKHT